MQKQLQLDQCPSIVQKRLFLKSRQKHPLPKSYQKLSPNHQRIPCTPDNSQKPLSRKPIISRRQILHLVSLNPHSRCLSHHQPLKQSPFYPYRLLCFEGRRTILLHYKQNTASGPDGISSIMLRNTASSIAPQRYTVHKEKSLRP